RCETTLSQQEVAEGYKDIKDLSVIAKFELIDEPGTFVLAWTTTPWTLIGNVALAVGKNIEYLILNIDEENYVIAQDRISEVLKNQKYKVIKEVKGKDLIGKKYKPLFDYYSKDNSSVGELKNRENGWKIYAADFVTTDEGTGVVHIAPAFGEDDMNLGKEHNLPFIQHIGMDGVFKDEVTDFKGMHVKPIENTQATDVEIIKYLAKKDLLFSKEKYEHSYPHCWRCDTPLLNYATSSWFVKVTDIKEKALKLAKEINWTPKHLKEGRFGQWLEGARDWSISRQRFWASAIPIWRCTLTPDPSPKRRGEVCGEIKVIGSVAELEKLSGEKVDDLHKHVVDKITFPCKCGGTMKRVPDVLDCWFESGSMPYAQKHYPFENKKEFENNFPAEFIAEGVDQTRAWFYYLHVIATAIKNKPAFKNVIVNGIVLAEDGKKMAKRLQNYPDPMEIMEKHGADKLRYYLCSASVVKAEDLNFSEKDLVEQTRFFNVLLNVLTFYKMFAPQISDFRFQISDLTNVLDKWITARLEETKKIVTEKMDNYDLHAIREIPVFIDDLSTWYIRRSRDRFKGDDEKDKQNALATTKYVLMELAKTMAPFMPFTAEHIYQELGADVESVHLKEWPEVKEEWIDEKVIEEMEATRKIVEMGLAKRDEAGIKVKQPLSKLRITNYELRNEYENLIKDELNVKSVKINKGEGELAVELDIKLTPELKQEGIKRELVRAINNARKNAGMTIQDRAVIFYQTDSKDIKEAFAKFGEEIKKDTLADDLQVGSGNVVKINNEDVELKVEKK
ncbi:MAG: isoleucine--tRNA ligase, partial [Patescibacteria group bacterium]